MKLQLFQYDFKGVRYCEGVEAESEEDMRARLKAMAETAVYDGEFIAEVEASADDIAWAEFCPPVVN